VAVLQSIPEIKSVHHIHLWQLDDDKIYFEAHLVLNDNLRVDHTLDVTLQAKQLLNAQFGIGHTTFQYEYLPEGKCKC
jgi:cobalt-zinc-cadmium efflux system protein